MRLSKQQSTLVKRKKGITFLEGAAGTGKTTVGVRRMLNLIKSDVPADSILVIVPQRTAAIPYDNALRNPKLVAGGRVTVTTIGGLALQMVKLFWPLVAESAGFRYPEQPPTFLSLETAQYFMTRVVGPVIDEKMYFDTVAINRNRLYSQILDNLNKAAVVGFSHTEIGGRLKLAWAGEVSQKRIYDDAQDCANLFRDYCLEHNLLDFSLQLELFTRHLWQMPQCRDYLTSKFVHLIVDNVEEDNPAMHDLLREWLPDCVSALVIYDVEAGYRRFLGSDPGSAYSLKDVCGKQSEFNKSYTTSPDLRAFGVEMERSLHRPTPPEKNGGNPRDALVYGDHRYHPQMIDWVTDEIAQLVYEHGVPPDEIVVLAPFLSDALRFALRNRLEERKVAVQSHRPSRALRDEPAARCMLTLAQIAHPQWEMKPAPFDAAYALMTAIDKLDLVRAQLLASIVYQTKNVKLTPFDAIRPEMQERITYTLGKRYEKLQSWLNDYAKNAMAELDFFFSHLFGEILSQDGFGFHHDFDAARVAYNLIESARRFRWTVEDMPLEKPVSQEYVEMVRGGIIANQYDYSRQSQTGETVLLAPAYTFLMSNQAVDYQFWLNVGSGGWWERLYQPLTHPYVLSRGWAGGIWTDADEFEVRQEALYRLSLGLIRRCRKKIYLGFSQLGEQGYEQHGPLLGAVQRMLRRMSREETQPDV